MLEEVKLIVRISQESEGQIRFSRKKENMLELMNNIVMYLRGIKYKGNWRTIYFLKVNL